MGWAVGYDSRWNRDIGYGVAAGCDHPGCGERIDRGLGYVCGGRPFGGEDGCGLYFCDGHLAFVVLLDADGVSPQLCERCQDEQPPFAPKPDIAEWLEWKLTDKSWAQWRSENPAQVAEAEAALHASAG